MKNHIVPQNDFEYAVACAMLHQAQLNRLDTYGQQLGSGYKRSVGMSDNDFRESLFECLKREYIQNQKKGS